MPIITKKSSNFILKVFINASRDHPRPVLSRNLLISVTMFFNTVNELFKIIEVEFSYTTDSMQL